MSTGPLALTIAVPPLTSSPLPSESETPASPEHRRQPGEGAGLSPSPGRSPNRRGRVETRRPPFGLNRGPRSRLFKFGVGALSDADLLALLFGTGSRGCPAQELAATLLAGRTLGQLAERGWQDLCGERGIGPMRAAQILAGFEMGRRHLRGDEERGVVRGPEDIHAATADLREARKEHFVTFYLNARHQVISRETVSIGSLNASIVHPREVYEPAVRASAAAVILVHNHPSGETDPSDDDLTLTRRLVQVGDLLGIGVLDHIIVGRNGFTSLKQAGYL